MIPYGSILPKLTERSWAKVCRRNGVNPKRMTAILRAQWIAHQAQATFFQSILEQNEKRRQATMARRTANAAAPQGAQVAAAAGSQSNDPLAALSGLTAAPAPVDPMAALAGLGQPQATQAPPTVQIQSSPGLDALAPQVSRDSINAALGGGPSLNGHGGHDPALAAAVQGTQQKVDGILAQLKTLQAAIENVATQQNAGFQEMAKGIGAVLGKVQELASAASAQTAHAVAPSAAPQTQTAATPGAAQAAPTGAPVDPQQAAMDQVISIIVPAIREKYKDPNFPRLGVEPQNVNVETILAQVLASSGVNLPGATIVAVLKARGHVQNGVITV